MVSAPDPDYRRTGGTDLTFEEYFPGSNAEKWLKAECYVRTGPSPLINRDDLYQEGMIEMWKAYLKFGPKDGYLIKAARWYMLDLLRDSRSQLGDDRGWRRGRHGQPANRTTLQYGLMPKEPVVSPDYGFDLVELYDIRQEVRDRIAELAPGYRIKIFDRFWLDLPVGFASWWYRAKEQLEPQLQHLKGIV